MNPPTLAATNRAEWRDWLEEHHATDTEIWLLLTDRADDHTLTYLDAVEEALCFGWIDSTAKRHSPAQTAQRFSPRRRRSNWTELNKERARRLIRLGLMTDAGRAMLPDLNLSVELAEDIEAALKAAPPAWDNFLAFPELYRRVRIGYIEEVRKHPTEFDKRLRNFVTRTSTDTMFGNWNDGGRLP